MPNDAAYYFLYPSTGTNFTSVSTTFSQIYRDAQNSSFQHVISVLLLLLVLVLLALGHQRVCCLLVYLSACLSNEPHVQISPNFLYITFKIIAVARSSSDGSAIRCDSDFVDMIRYGIFTCTQKLRRWPA